MPRQDLPCPSFDAMQTALWADQADAVRRVADRQAKDLHEIAQAECLLKHLILKWARWRMGQCDCDEMSPEEEQLLSALGDLRPQT